MTIANSLLKQTTKRRPQVRRRDLHRDARTTRLANRIRARFLAVQQQHAGRPDQDARVHLPIQARLPTRLGRQEEYRWGQLDVQGAEGEWAGFLDQGPAYGYWGEVAELLGCR